MTEPEIILLHKRINEMPEDQLSKLDFICEGLRKYQVTDPKPITVLPNRVIALACVDQLNAWEKTILARE